MRRIDRGVPSDKLAIKMEDKLQNGVKIRPSEMIGYDARFPNVNRSRACWQYYADYHKCLKKFGEGYKKCDFFKHSYKDACPLWWTDRWDELREEGAMPGRYLLK